MLRTCSASGCESPHYAKGFCNRHYKRVRIHGTTDDVRPSFEERFWAKVDFDADGGCWNWEANRQAAGYGHFAPKHGTHALAHRLSYELLVGPIPDGLQIDHLCRNKSCVNPSHLEPVTAQVNMLRAPTLAAVNAAKTSCPRGHAYDETNTYVRKGTTDRGCRKCRTAQVNEHYARSRTH